MRRFLLPFVVVISFMALVPVVYARDYSGDQNDNYYTSSDGSRVHRPSKDRNAADGPITADCRDGTFSHSHHHQGTCSGHGGVKNWE